MIIKYSISFKRILMVAVQNKGKLEQMKVGEVQNFQQNPDGSLDIIAFIWPQIPDRLREQISKNPSMMGMTAETLPCEAPLVFPDGTQFDEKEDETQLDELRARIKELEEKISRIERLSFQLPI